MSKIEKFDEFTNEGLKELAAKMRRTVTGQSAGEEIEKLPLEIPPGTNNHSFVRMGQKKTIFDVFFEHGGTTIFDETNEVVGDGHLGEKGHFIQYELFYKYITKNNLI